MFHVKHAISATFDSRTNNTDAYSGERVIRADGLSK